jgi:hypothetical protein
MSETAQIILAAGFAVFLGLVALVAIIWSLRCRADALTYRNPLMFGMPTVVGLAYVLHQLIK